MCLLVSSCTECELTQVFAISSLLTAITVALLAVIRDIPSRLCLCAGAPFLLTFIVWLYHAVALGSGKLPIS